MYFANDEHERNFDMLLELYSEHRSSSIANDVQYVANIYIAAYPDIFKCLNLNELDTNAGPLFNLMEWNEEKQMHIVSAGLAGSTTRLTTVGLSLYNGYPVDLDDVFGSITSEQIFNVIIQACKIRFKK